MPAAARVVIERYASEIGAPLVRVEQVVRVERERAEERGAQVLSAITPRGSYRLHLAAAGAFQRTNAATAIAVLEQLADELRPEPEEIVAALRDVAIPGRMELVRANPTVVFDIAHNAEKAESLVASLREWFPHRRVHYVVAIGESKDARRIIEILGTVNLDVHVHVVRRDGTKGDSSAAPGDARGIARGVGPLDNGSGRSADRRAPDGGDRRRRRRDGIDVRRRGIT